MNGPWKMRRASYENYSEARFWKNAQNSEIWLDKTFMLQWVDGMTFKNKYTYRKKTH